MRPVPVVLRPIAFTLQLSVREGKHRNTRSVRVKRESFVSFHRSHASASARILFLDSPSRARRIHREGLTHHATKTYIYAYARTDSRRTRT